MRSEKSERRRNPRIFFLKKDDMHARLRMLSGEEALLQVLVKDLSLAGIGFLLERTETVTVRPQSRLVITKINGTNAAVDFLAQTTLEVEWVLDTAILDHIGFGCRFLNLNKGIQAKLEEYILAWG